MRSAALPSRKPSPTPARWPRGRPARWPPGAHNSLPPDGHDSPPKAERTPESSGQATSATTLRDGSPFTRYRCTRGASARGLRVDRRHSHRGVGGQERVDRLAVPPAVRLGRLLRGAPRRRDARALAPVPDRRFRTRRRYRADTLVLETEHETDTGSVHVTDFMRLAGRRPGVVRLVGGTRGVVSMRSELLLRFDYGLAVPWLRQATASVRPSPGRTRSNCGPTRRSTS